MNYPDLPTPYYLIRAGDIEKKLEQAKRLKELSGVKIVLALKCFASWAVFEQMAAVLDGSTSSSLNELKLGFQDFPGENHAYSVAYHKREIVETAQLSDKMIFNSAGQFDLYADAALAANPELRLGLRINPGISSSVSPTADPARPFSRLGERDKAAVFARLDRLSGAMMHFNCDNADFDLLSSMLDTIEKEYAEVLPALSWLSLGGGIHFTGEGYPLEKLAERLKAFAEKWQLQLYLEPGEALLNGCGTLETEIVDIVDNGKTLLLVNASAAAHMPDLLLYGYGVGAGTESGRLIEDKDGDVLVCGNSCLAGDIFGSYRREGESLRIGDRISLTGAAAYTIVQKSWFCGQPVHFAYQKADGSFHTRRFYYDEYRSSLS